MTQFTCHIQLPAHVPRQCTCSSQLPVHVLPIILLYQLPISVGVDLQRWPASPSHVPITQIKGYTISDYHVTVTCDIIYSLIKTDSKISEHDLHYRPDDGNSENRNKHAPFKYNL